MQARVSTALSVFLLAGACSSDGGEPAEAELGADAPVADAVADTTEDPDSADTADAPSSDASPDADLPGDDDADTLDTEPDTPEPSGPYIIEDPGHTSDTAAQLEEFYLEYGGRDAFPVQHVDALEALLLAEDDLEAGSPASAGERVRAVFAAHPYGDGSWWIGSGGGTGGSNVGHPVAYYGLRMLEHVVGLGEGSSSGTLRMTGVIAPCASARRPRLPDLEAEVVDLTLDPAVLENDARRLFLATQLFRRWVQSITDGVELELRLYVLDECTTVDFTDDGSVIVIYPDAQGMIDAVSDDVSRETDIWWAISPNATVGEEFEVGRTFIGGGMGLSADGRPLFLSDDLWFVRKPNHMGTGDWMEAELRSYHPQWFQHEFMHHLFRTWPEFGLEVTGHQWFDRETWPDDFEGVFEADYYSEAITKRLLDASPGLAEGLQAPDFRGMDEVELARLVGSYRREPVENEWHEVTLTLEGDGLRWSNAAGVSWVLVVARDELRTGPDCPYGESAVGVEFVGGALSGVWSFGEKYSRVD